MYYRYVKQPQGYDYFGRNGQSTRILSEIINKALILANSIRLEKKKEKARN